jgi:hypothetical protein
VPSAPEDPRREALEDFAWRSRSAFRRARLDEATAEAIGALTEAGVEVLLLKGVALARSLYAPEEQRTYYDVDLLVAPTGLAAARRVVTELGYRNVSADRGVDDVAGILHAEAWHRVVPEIGHEAIDLHWRLDGCSADSETVWSALRAERGQIEIAGVMSPTLGVAGLALHVALHAAQHGPDDVKALADLRRALERWSPERWGRAASLAAQLGAAEPFAAGLRLLPAGSGLADRLGLSEAPAIAWNIANRAGRPRGTFHVDALRQARTRGERLYVIRRALLPSRAWITWEMRWAARGRMHLLAAYAVHILRAPVWALRAVGYRRRSRLSRSPSREAGDSGR